MLNFKTSYVSQLPLEGNSPKLTITGDEIKEYTVLMGDNKTKQLLFKGPCTTNTTIIGSRQWYTEWLTEVRDENNELIFSEIFDPTFKKIFIKIDAYALGDNIAWMPYIEEFRRKHTCDIVCSTFFNKYFEEAYPEILFVEPNTRVGNIFAQYYIGANEQNNPKYGPTSSLTQPLQKIACDILGLDYKEIVTNLAYRYRPSNVEGKYVCISEYASDVTKHWKVEGGWQSVVDFLTAKGYKVVVISKEPTNLVGVIDRTGDMSLDERMSDLAGAEFFIGVSSGLSWVSWALGTHVVMISDCTPHYHEFKKNITRIGGESLAKVDYSLKVPTSTKKVIYKLEELVS